MVTRALPAAAAAATQRLAHSILPCILFVVLWPSTFDRKSILVYAQQTIPGGVAELSVSSSPPPTTTIAIVASTSASPDQDRPHATPTTSAPPNQSPLTPSPTPVPTTYGNGVIGHDASSKAGVSGHTAWLVVGVILGVLLLTFLIGLFVKKFAPQKKSGVDDEDDNSNNNQYNNLQLLHVVADDGGGSSRGGADVITTTVAPPFQRVRSFSGRSSTGMTSSSTNTTIQSNVTGLKTKGHKTDGSKDDHFEESFRMLQLIAPLPQPSTTITTAPTTATVAAAKPLRLEKDEDFL